MTAQNFKFCPERRCKDSDKIRTFVVYQLEIMKNIAKAFSVEVIGMYSNCGISSMLETGTGPYLKDGLHPNVDGQKLMGKYATSRIREYIY